MGRHSRHAQPARRRQSGPSGQPAGPATAAAAGTTRSAPDCWRSSAAMAVGAIAVVSGLLPRTVAPAA